MGVRQALNENPAIGFAVVGGLILVAAVAIFFQTRPVHRGPAPAPMEFYSDDDGKTWFADTASRITPFVDANNKQAVVAVVYQCRDGKPFVGYLMRYTEDARKAALAFQQQTGRIPAHGSLMNQNEVKRPGAKGWVRFDPHHPKPYTDVTNPACPGGRSELPQIVRPTKPGE